MKPLNKYLLALPFLAVLIIFFPALNFPFQFDDYVTIVNNGGLIDFEDVFNLKLIFNPNYRTISFLSWSLSYYFGGENPLYFRIVSLIFHLVNGLLFLLLLNKIEKVTKSSIGICSKFLALSLFLIHPIQTQSVIYISQQSTILAAFFYLLLLIGYFKFRFDFEKSNTVKLFFYILFLAIIFILGIKSKQTVATALLIIPLVEFLFFWKTKYSKQILLCSGAVLFLGVLGYFLTGNKTAEVIGISRVEYFQTQVIVVGNYLQLLFFPKNQSIDHFVPIQNQLSEIIFWFSLFFHATAVFIAFYFFRKDARIAFGIGIFYMALSLESSFFPIRDAMFEHRVYFPIIGFAIVAAMLIEKIKNSGFKYVVYFLAFILVIVSMQRVKVWESQKKLWKDVVRVSPQNPRSYANLGSIFYNQNNLDSAQIYFEKAISIKPDHYESLNNLGLIHINNEEYKVAIHYLNKSIALNPKNEYALNNLGICWEKSNAFGQAISYYKRAIKVNPYFKDALLNQAVVYEKVAKYDEAIYNYLRLEKIDKTYPFLFFNLGNCYLQSNNYINAKNSYFKSITIDGKTANNLSNLGICYYHLQNNDSAIFYIKEALKIDSNRLDLKRNLDILKK